MFSIYSREHVSSARQHATKTLKSKNLRLVWEISVILFFWRLFDRKRYVVTLLFYIRGKYGDVYEPLFSVRDLSENQLNFKLLTNNWNYAR